MKDEVLGRAKFVVHSEGERTADRMGVECCASETVRRKETFQGARGED